KRQALDSQGDRVIARIIAMLCVGLSITGCKPSSQWSGDWAGTGECSGVHCQFDVGLRLRDSADGYVVGIFAYFATTEHEAFSSAVAVRGRPSNDTLELEVLPACEMAPAPGNRIVAIRRPSVDALDAVLTTM